MSFLLKLTSSTSSWNIRKSWRHAANVEMMNEEREKKLIKNHKNKDMIFPSSLLFFVCSWSSKLKKCESYYHHHKDRHLREIVSIESTNYHTSTISNNVCRYFCKKKCFLSSSSELSQPNSLSVSFSLSLSKNVIELEEFFYIFSSLLLMSVCLISCKFFLLSSSWKWVRERKKNVCQIHDNNFEGIFMSFMHEDFFFLLLIRIKMPINFVILFY